MTAEQDVTVSIRLKAMNLMAHREYSRKELELRLTQKFPDYPVPIVEVLNKLESDGLLSDERFAECFIAASIRKGRGPQRIKRELMERGINLVMVNDKLAQSEVDWFAHAKAVFGKKFSDAVDEQLPSKDSLRQKAQQSRFMQYRGFDFEQIRYCVDGAE